MRGSEGRLSCVRAPPQGNSNRRESHPRTTLSPRLALQLEDALLSQPADAVHIDRDDVDYEEEGAEEAGGAVSALHDGMDEEGEGAPRGGGGAETFAGGGAERRTRTGQGAAGS